MTNFNEWMNTLLYKNISLTLYSWKGWCLLCVRDEWRQGQTAILTQVLLLTIAALLPHLGLGCSTGGRGCWGPQPSVCKLVLTLAILFPTNSTAAGTCLCSFITPTCFHLSTQMHLLIDSLDKSQYITQEHRYYHSKLKIKYHNTGNGWIFVLENLHQCCHRSCRNTSQSFCLKNH